MTPLFWYVALGLPAIALGLGVGALFLSNYYERRLDARLKASK